MVNRRDFLLAGAAGIAAAESAPAQTSAVKTIGIQVGAVSFVDEGTEVAGTDGLCETSVGELTLGTSPDE